VNRSSLSAPEVHYYQQLRHERNLAAAERAIRAMKRQGPTLLMQYAGGRRSWSLSDGRSIPAAVATLIINNASVMPAGDGLFSDLPAQTWRITE
jgi:hypothetical protein